MKQTFKFRLRRVAASVLAAAALFSQPILTESAVYAAEPKAAGSPVKVAEQNPFDGLCTSKHSTKISDYNANVMEVEISGEKYLAYCLNPNRYGSDNVSGGAVGSSGYSIQVYDLDDPALQNVPDFQLDQSILLAMQGVIASGGYTGGGDAAAGKLMDPYDASRPLYRDHLQAYAVTKYAMWSLASGWYGPDWKVYSGSSYKPQDNAYLLQSLTNIIGWGTNWKEFNDENLYVNPMDYDSDGDVWTEDPDTGERYVEFQVITGKTGDNRGHVSLGKEYTVTPDSSLPAGFHLEKTDGTRITGSTTLRGAVSSSYGSEDKFRLVAEAGTELSALGKDAVVASVSTQIEAFALKYGVAIPPAGYSKVQNYALIPENTWKQVSADVKLSVEAPESTCSFRIQKVDGSTALSGAEFRVESADGSETYEQQGDYLLPCLTVPDEKEQLIGVWGQRHLRYLKEYRRATYITLLTSGRLNNYLADTDRQAQERMERLTEQMKRAQGITEQLKAENALEWVQRMNNIQACARGIVEREIVFA